MWKTAGNLIFFALLAAAVMFVSVNPLFIGIPSKSMEPLLHVGDLVMTKKVNPQQVKQGDIIIVKVPESAQKQYFYPDRVIHRVSRVERNAEGPVYHIKGDNNKDEDPFTLFPKDVEGGYARHVPKLGFAILFIHSKYGKIFLISVGILYAIYQIVEFIEKRKAGWKRRLVGMLVGEVVQETRKLQEEVRLLRVALQGTEPEQREKDADKPS